MATQSGVLAALLAEEGYTGTEAIFEGKEGFCRQMGEGYKPEVLFDGLGKEFKIRDCSFKAFPTEFLTQSPVTAALKLVKTHDIQWQDVDEVTVHTIARAVDILADPTKYHPTSKETADHSMPYCVGAAIMDRMVTPLQFRKERIADNKLIDLIQRIRVIADDKLEAEFPKLQPSVVDIRLKSGDTYTQRADFAKGDPRETMTDDDLMDKFYGLTADFLSDGRRKEIRDIVYGLENIASIGNLMSKLAV